MGGMWATEGPGSLPFIADGSLGWAAYQMANSFGLDVDSNYDITCPDTGAWPEPADGTFEPLYLEIDSSTGEVTQSATHTNYSLLVEGDVKRAIMDADPTQAAMTTEDRRAGALYSGTYCIEWYNDEFGTSPQPWATGDCAITWAEPLTDLDPWVEQTWYCEDPTMCAATDPLTVTDGTIWTEA